MRAFLLSVAVSLWLLSALARAGDVPVDLELIIAIDGSASMDAGEQALQRQGYISAFMSRELVLAVTSGPLHRIAVAFVEWSDVAHQRIVVPWTLIDGEASAAEFSRGLDAPVHNDAVRTSISSALLFSAALFDGNGYSGGRRVIDISGDGVNNAGPSLEAARAWVVTRGITINGLPLVLKDSMRRIAHDPTIESYYRDCVIGGPDAFFLTVQTRSDFGVAIRQKLVREIAFLRIGSSGNSVVRAFIAANCGDGTK